ncbi:uncharacterized protein LOC113362787 [Papaver somniferum]|uniref:uncharacterized protein LOC113362787 n=1 Tax=Papaver somniferum TaxID=3469 RepID=UPI000E6FFF0E|nr:uncharacterized protein LOC113362787 [Papaver somniferum]
MEARLSKWSFINVSEAGRSVMIRNVTNSISVHHMSSFKIQDSTISKINSVQQQFWGNKKNNKGKHFIAWRDVNKSKEEGGLGFRDLEVFNRALLAKFSWKLCTDDTSIYVRSLRAKYFPNGLVFNTSEHPKFTWSWRSISSELQFVNKYSLRSVGDGKKILIWKYRWIEGLDSPPIPKASATHYQDFTFVVQLYDTNKGGWNISLLSTSFDPATLTLILKISIHHNLEDRLVWSLERNGCFSVK